MQYKFRKPTKEDARYIAEHIKKDNLMEMQALIGGHVLDELLASIDGSDYSGCCCVDGRPIALYGLTRQRIFDASRVVWLLMTAEAEQYKVFVARQTLKGLRAIVRDFGTCCNVCNVENKSIMRWVEWMGGKKYGPIPYGIYKLPHYYFVFDESILKEG